MVRRLIILSLLVVTGCGGGTSSPTTPAQIPTSVEYAGGTVEGDISVLTGQTIQFAAKAADGNAAYATEITTTLTTPDGNAADSSYGSCSLNSSDSTLIDCTGPDVLPTEDVNPRVVYTFTYGDTTLSTSTKSLAKATELGNFTGRIGVSSQTIDNGQYSFSTVTSVSDCNGPVVTSNGNGWVFMACIDVITPGSATAKISYSNDDGQSWSPSPYEITGINNTNVIKALKTTEAINTATAYFAYNGATNMMYLHQITGNADGSITVDPPKFVSGAVYDIAVDTNGNAYVVSADGETTCPYDTDEYITNLQFRKVTSDGGFGQGYTVNTTDCTVKANPGAEPRIAVTPDGTLAYITWRDIGSGGDPSPDLTYVRVAEIATSTPSMNWTTTVAATSAGEGSSVLAAGQYAATDKNGNMALTWDESASNDTSTTMRTFLSPLDGSSDSFSSYLIDTTLGILNSDPLQLSGTALQIDYASAYHMFYRNDLGLQYTMGTVSNSALTTTIPINMSTEGSFSFPYGALSTDTDWSGKNFITWQENSIEGITAYVAVGTTN